MFSFNFASKMLNTIMGNEEPPGGPQAQPQHGMPPGQGQPQGARPSMGFPPRPGPGPSPGGPGGSPRPGYGAPAAPTFSGPRPTPGARPGPPTFGGPQRPLGGAGMPHRFNGPQPPPGAQPQRQMPPGQPQQPQQMQMRGQQQMPNQGVNIAQMRPRAPMPQQVAPAKPGAVVPDVDLSHLSAEEREMIESVMAKAQQLEQEGPSPLAAALGPGMGPPGQQRMMRPEDLQRQGVDFAPRICPICRQRDMSGREGPPGQECTECRTMVCKACGGMTPHIETKRPEWTCGNCIKRRRMGPPTTVGNTVGPLGQTLGPRPPGQFIQPGQSQGDWDGSRRPSSGQMQLSGSPQPPGQQRWESERESDKLESLEVESWNDVGQFRNSDMSPPHSQSQSQELTKPDRIGLDVAISTNTTTSTSTFPPEFLPPSNYQSMGPTALLPSSSVEGINRPPSFAEVMRSRSQSIEMEHPIVGLSSAQNSSHVGDGSRRASEAIPGKSDLSSFTFSSDPYPYREESTPAHASHFSSLPPRPSSSIDEKANSLMEELSKLQSAVDNTLKRRQQVKPSPGDQPRFPISRTPSPSPSPTSPVRETRLYYKSPESPSPPQSSYKYDFHSPESPEPPPGVRKAIVLKEHDLDDYKSSSEEDSGSGSDEERKGIGDGFYEHSPGDVYTIPEEEDEGGSPTGGDLVSSLNRPGIQGSMTDNGSPRHRLPGQEGVGVGMPMSMPGVSPDPRHPIRPQLRPQRSLDNRLVNPQMSHYNSNQTHQNVIFSNSNTQLANQMNRVDNQISATSIAGLTAQLGTLTTAAGNIPDMMPQQPQSQLPQTSQHSQQQQHLQQQMQPQAGYSAAMSTSEMAFQQQPQSQFTVANGALQQHQQTTQFGQTTSTDTLGANTMGGVGGDWNSNMSMAAQSIQSSMNSVSPIPMSDQQYSTSQTQPYQQQNPYQVSPQHQSQVQGVMSTSTISAFDPHSQQQLGQTQGIMTQAQQAQMQNQLLTQDLLNNQLYQQKNAQLPQTQPTQNAQLAMQQSINTSQQQVQMGQQAQQSQNMQMGQYGQMPLAQSNQGQIQQNMQNQQQQQQLHQQQLGVGTSQSYANQGMSVTPDKQQSQWQSSPNQMYDMGGHPQQSTQYGQSQLQSGVGLGTQSQMQQQHQQYSQQQQQQQQQPMGMMQHGNQQQHQQQQSSLNQGLHPHQQGLGANLNSAQVATSKAGSISGLLADFSRALGLGSTSPRPSPSEDKSEPFPVPSSGVGGVAVSAHSSYDPYHQPQQAPHQVQHGLNSQVQQVQQSAFTPINERSLSYLQQHQSYLQQQPQHLQQSIGLHNLGYSSGIGQSHLISSSLQQYPTLISSQGGQPHTQVVQQGGQLISQPTALGGVGVGVVGGLTPAQAHMYQQQMALQHQQQHMKKTSRRAHLTSSGDVRRDGASTVLIGGQGLAGGMTIGTLTPAVVTSLGTFISGNQVLGTSLLQQPVAVTPFGTPIGTPVGTPRSGRDPGGDSSDTMSETDSQKSLRMRRKLPCLPPDQEAAPLPMAKKRERHRSQEFRSLSPMRLSSMDGTVQGRSYPLSSLSLSRPSASESNLRKLTMGNSDPIPRPGSALGCLQASSVICSVGGKQDTIYPLGGNILSSSPAFGGMNLRTTTSGLTSDLTTTTSVLSGLYPSYKQSQDSWSSHIAELSAALPPDLRHLLHKGSGPVSDHDLSGLSMPGLTSSLGDTSLNVGSHLPSYMRTLREQLQEERRQLLSEERRRLEALRERDRELGARLDAVTSRAASDALRSRTDLSRDGGLSRSAGASPLLTRKLKGHRRQLSDPKLSLPFSPIQEDGDNELQDFDRIQAGILMPPYKSYEYESLEDSALLQRQPVVGISSDGDWDHSQSYLASSWAAAGGALRETAITSMGGVHEDDEIRNQMSSCMGRRSSEGETWSHAMVTSRSSASREKRHMMRKSRKSRSWHPSPYVSEEDDEEEDSLSREEKKARIKAEIARRRQHIQQRGVGQGDAYGLSRLAAEHERHSVLKSVDQLLRDQYSRYDASFSGTYRRAPPSSIHPGLAAELGRSSAHHLQYHLARAAPTGQIISPSASEEDRSIERIASTFRNEHDYASMLYERLGEMSPMATDTESMCEMGAPAAMPLLPDMPTRSRRLLEDLGSAPIGMGESRRGGTGIGQSMKSKYSVSSQGLNVPYRTVM